MIFFRCASIQVQNNEKFSDRANKGRRRESAPKGRSATVEQATDEKLSSFTLYWSVLRDRIAETGSPSKHLNHQSVDKSFFTESPENQLLAAIPTTRWPEISPGRPMKIGILGTR